MTSTTRCGAVAAALLAGALAVPAAASAAPTLTLDRECYTPGRPMVHTGSGFTPGGAIRLFANWEGRFGTYDGMADATGALNRTIDAPDLDAPRTTLMIGANDVTRLEQGAPPEEAVAGTEAQLSQWDVSVSSWDTPGPTRAKPGRRTRVHAVGWVATGGETLYAHYLRRGRLVKTVEIGQIGGVCGDLDARMREFPFRKVRPGAYVVQFDTTRAFSSDVDWIRYKRVTVGRRAIASVSGSTVERRRGLTPRPPRPAWLQLRAGEPGPAA